MAAQFNMIAVFVAALVPMVLGFIWYNPKVFGKAWMDAAGMTEEKMKGANMPLIFGLSFVLSLMLAFFSTGLAIHQSHLISLFVGHPDFVEGTDLYNTVAGLLETYGSLHRTVTHGLVHGIVTGIFFVLPVLGTNALFERKGFKYIAINCGYWTVCLTIMFIILSIWMP